MKNKLTLNFKLPCDELQELPKIISLRTSKEISAGHLFHLVFPNLQRIELFYQIKPVQLPGSLQYMFLSGSIFESLNLKSLVNLKVLKL